MYLDPVQTLFLVVAFLYDTTLHGGINIMGPQYAPNIPPSSKLLQNLRLNQFAVDKLKLAEEYHSSVSKNQKCLLKICSKSALALKKECALFGMCSFWNVPILECALFGMCSNVLCQECALFGMCPFWNVLCLERALFWICALFGMCPFWNEPILEQRQHQTKCRLARLRQSTELAKAENYSVFLSSIR